MTEPGDLESVVDTSLDIQEVNAAVDETWPDAVCPRCEQTGAVAGSVPLGVWMCGYCCARGNWVQRGA